MSSLTLHPGPCSLSALASSLRVSEHHFRNCAYQPLFSFYKSFIWALQLSHSSKGLLESERHENMGFPSWQLAAPPLSSPSLPLCCLFLHSPLLPGGRQGFYSLHGFPAPAPLGEVLWRGGRAECICSSFAHLRSQGLQVGGVNPG